MIQTDISDNNLKFWNFNVVVATNINKMYNDSIPKA